VLTRDGTSSYYINNQPVRRRDVQDVFLGTGLGPRAYAIIGQGTISRIIESKPEELRLFLEEAAGVSKYKERRRETENRLGDTRENLTRVEDILRELNANLEKLEKQAEVAARYNTLQGDVTKKQHQLWFLKRSESDADQAKIKTDSEKAINDLESRTADLRHIEAELETVRQAHYAAGDQVNQAQGQLYEASAEVGRLEGEIRFVVEGRQRVEQRLVQLKEQMGQWGRRRDEAEAEIETWPGKASRPRSRPSCWPRRSKSTTRAARHGRGAAAPRTPANAEQRAAVVQVQQQIQVLAADQRNIEDQSRQLTQRRERLRADQQRTGRTRRSPAAVCSSSMRPRRKPPRRSRRPPARTAGSGAAARRRPPGKQQAVNTESARHADLSARHGSAACAAGKGAHRRQARKPWLAKHGLDGLQGLWSRIHIEQGWENALEAALRERMGSLEVSRLDMVRAFANDAPPAKLAFYQPAAGRCQDRRLRCRAWPTCCA
jgi:chromosome segregation protein